MEPSSADTGDGLSVAGDGASVGVGSGSIGERPGTDAERRAPGHDARGPGPGVDTQYCMECGSIIKRSDIICPYCGVRVDNRARSFNKDRTLFAMLAIFGGWLGLHRFYMSQNKLGVIYAVGSVISLAIVIPVPWLVGIGEGIRALVKDDDWFQEKFTA